MTILGEVGGGGEAFDRTLAKLRLCSLKVLRPKALKTNRQSPPQQCPLGREDENGGSEALTASSLQNEDVVSPRPVCRNKTRWQKPRMLRLAVGSPPTGCSLGNKWSRQRLRRVSSGFQMKMK